MMEDNKSKSESILTGAIEYNNYSLSRRVWQMYVQVGFVGLLIAITLWYVMTAGSRITTQYGPLIDASMEIKYEATIAHLWFEEFITGDRQIEIDEVWRHIDKAEWFALAMLEGAQSADVTYTPHNDLELQQRLSEVLNEIRIYREIAKERYANLDKSLIGSDIDQRFDSVFTHFLKDADSVESTLQGVVSREVKRFRQVQTGLIVVCILLTGIIGVILHRFQKRQSIFLSRIKASNQQLAASEQQLKATNQQLMAEEQQLKASNQQLSASEQQLKAANQQLSSSEQQLKASNQQLIASEQQLRAANQQLSASEQQLRAANLQLTASQQKLRLHVQHTPLAVIQWDTDFNVTEWNNAAENIFGFTAEEAIGRHAAGLIVHESAKKIVDELWQSLLDQKGGKRSTNENLTKDQKIIICDWYNTPLIDAAGNTIGVASLVLDITERRRAEKKLIESEKALVESQKIARIGTYVLNISAGTWTSSEVLAGIFGLEDEDEKRLTDVWISIIHPDWKQEMIDYLTHDVVEKRGRFDKEYMIIRKNDGAKRWVHGMGELELNDKGEPIVMLGTIQDITERKKAEEELQESEERFRTLMLQSPAVMEIYNLDGLQIEVNKAYEELWGFPASTTVNKFNVLKSKEVEDTGLMEYVKRAYKGEAVTVPEYIFDPTGETESGGPGRVRWLSTKIYPLKDASGKVISIVITHEDITERKKAEDKLRESEEKFREIITKLPMPVIITESNQDIELYNDKFIEIFGYTKKDITKAEDWWNTCYPDPAYRAKVRQSWEQEIKIAHDQKTEIPMQEWKLTCKDGSLKDVEFKFMPLGDISLIILNDITETRRLKALESRAERLETAGTIAGQVAHDFNNLLAPMMAYPEFIRDELPRNHPSLQYLDQIEKAAIKISDINQDLLALGRRGFFNLKVLNLNIVVQQALSEMDPYRETLACETNLSEDLMDILGGDAQLHRMISNLLHNAKDATQEVGRITITTENYYADDTSIAFGCVPKGEYVKLTISDTGCGIPPDIVQKIFDPFFTTKAADKKRGSGLGMSVVDAVIKDHNGFIDLRTKVGEGTSFYIYFPITRETIDTQESSKVSGGSETVLIVDDDEIQREVSTHLLTRLGYDVNSVESGEKAIEYLRNSPCDLIILDMVMPGGIDGAETYQRILEIRPRQKAIILSGFSESDRVLEAQKLGAGAFVRKPVSRIIIGAAVRTELDRKVKETAK